MKLVIIESPFHAPDLQQSLKNIEYGWACIRDSINRGEAPFASHLFYTNVLDDREPTQRAIGLQCGWVWLARADLVAVYTDLGISVGMTLGITKAKDLDIPLEYRSLSEESQ